MSGKLLVVSGPSGAGIREIVGSVLERRQDIGAVVPVTARKMKAGEQDGVGFYFYDLEGWSALKESGDLLECTEFAGNDYGTSRRLVKEQLENGKHVILSLEPERAAQLKQNMPEAIWVAMAPSAPVLEERYRALSRSAVELSVRLEQAGRQQALLEGCDTRICSDDPVAAARALEALLDG